MGYSDLGSYGAEIETPNIDHLTENGILFTQMHNTSKCFPSRAVLLTGQYAQQVGMDKSEGGLENAVMFGEVLSKVGYTTVYVGKHHGTDNPYLLYLSYQALYDPLHAPEEDIGIFKNSIFNT